MPKQKKSPRSESAKGRSHYKVKNWSEYNRSLKNRGSITLWMSEEVMEQWYYQGEKQKGGQYKYSDNCIEACCIVRKVYRLALRQTEGLVESIMEILQLALEVPDYTVLCRRAKALKISSVLVRKINKGEPLHIVMDSTGLKVYGEGEWKVRQHGCSKHRTWRKIHLAVNPEDGMIHAAEMTTNGVDDAAVVRPVLEKIKSKVKKFGGDGAYDKTKVYAILEKEKIKPIIPPRKNARISKHGNSKGRAKPRDNAIRYIRQHGRKKWKKAVHYHKRSIAETTMFRYKTILGDKLQSRIFENQCVEALLSCKILNHMAACGMPLSEKV
ncbi:MAG: IS5 family transposase [Chlamydiota bacterium]|nr:IS5 family transposase [Chlamydiota bacterium]